MPSSISIPSATPSHARVSRPVSFGSFRNPTSNYDLNSDHLGKHRGSETRTASRQPVKDQQSQSHKSPTDGGVFDLDEEVIQDRMTDDEAMDTHYPGVEYSENISWAGWDSFVDAGVSRQVL